MLAHNCRTYCALAISLACLAAPASGQVILWHSFGGTGDGKGPNGGLTLAGSTFFGTTDTGGSAGEGTVFQIGIDGSGYQIAHSFAGFPTDGTLRLARLRLRE